jgi:hypothetical protein
MVKSKKEKAGTENSGEITWDKTYKANDFGTEGEAKKLPWWVFRLAELGKKERTIVEKVVGSINYFDVKSFLLQKCNVQDLGSLRKADFLAHCKQYLLGQQPQQNQAETGGKTTKAAGKDRFSFSPGQVCFDGIDLRLPTGFVIDVLRKLVESFGKTVGYRELDDNSEAKNASEQLRDAKRKIKKALKANKTPCKIETKKGEGYIISPQTTHK